jgi:nucleoside-diphosphate-sugar epimerase
MGGRILVTGGGGFIGSALVAALVGAGRLVRVLDNWSRSDPRRLHALAGAIELVTGDVCNPGVVVEAAKDVDTIVHLASVNGTERFYTEPDRVLEVGIRGMLSVLDACRAYRIDSLFVASSSEVYHVAPIVPTDEHVPLVIPDLFNPRSSYAGQKIAAELLTLYVARPLVKRAVIFRPHNIYGPDMGFDHVIPQLSILAARLARGRGPGETVDMPIRGSLKATRAFMHIDDFTQALLLLLEKADGGVYNIGNAAEVTIEDVARLITERFSCRFRLVPEAGAAGSPQRRCPDIGKLHALGFTPRISLAAGIGPVVNWYAATIEEGSGAEQA